MRLTDQKEIFLYFIIDVMNRIPDNAIDLNTFGNNNCAVYEVANLPSVQLKVQLMVHKRHSLVYLPVVLSYSTKTMTSLLPKTKYKKCLV